MTVSLDVQGADAARRFIEAAQPDHPSLLDPAHVLDEQLGISNVPMGVWVDETGTLVRPPEPAFPWRPPFATRDLPPDMDPDLRARLQEAKRIRTQHEEYVGALRDWARHGSDSRHVLQPDEVVDRSRPRDAEQARAAACFELAQHLHRHGHAQDAVAWFREAHRLDPGNWTYKRQAWHLVDPRQGPTEEYEGDWLSDVRVIGAENYYPPLEL